MNDDIDIEEALKRYPSDPTAKVKQSVMSRYASTAGNRRAANRATGVWKTPVPLYIAAAAVVIAVGLSFVAGQRSSAPSGQINPLPQATYPSATPERPELTWEIAPNDVL